MKLTGQIQNKLKKPSIFSGESHLQPTDPGYGTPQVRVTSSVTSRVTSPLTSACYCRRAPWRRSGASRRTATSPGRWWTCARSSGTTPSWPTTGTRRTTSPVSYSRTSSAFTAKYQEMWVVNYYVFYVWNLDMYSENRSWVFFKGQGSTGWFILKEKLYFKVGTIWHQYLFSGNKSIIISLILNYQFSELLNLQRHERRQGGFPEEQWCGTVWLGRDWI